MIKGLASYGKVAYFITLSPYVGKIFYLLSPSSAGGRRDLAPGFLIGGVQGLGSDH